MTTVDQFSTETALPFGINDADQHSTPPFDAHERYIDPARHEPFYRPSSRI